MSKFAELVGKGLQIFVLAVGVAFFPVVLGCFLFVFHYAYNGNRSCRDCLDKNFNNEVNRLYFSSPRYEDSQVFVCFFFSSNMP
jgi:hypothetical protein